MMKRKEDLAFIAHVLDILEPIQKERLEGRLRLTMDCEGRYLTEKTVGIR